MSRKDSTLDIYCFFLHGVPMNAPSKQPETAHEACGTDGKEIFVHPLHKEHALDLPFWRDNEKLWALNVPVEEMPISELAWMIDIPFWEDAHGNIVISPREVLEDPAGFPDHYARVLKANTSFPLDIMQNGKGRWITLDGLHRLIRLYLRGETVIRVRKIPEDMVWQTARG
jgi:hypothetical protein